ncbi:MAG: polyprenol monophosphomannose synthase [Bacteroidota bacterium]|nr:polyprenol monophosphomannose synthase [Bacteroidota bacterium]
MSDSIVIIPTYNERENIEKILRKVFSLEKSFHVLIVDDNSPDGTANIVKTLMGEFSGSLFIEERKGKMGLGTAYIHGFKWAINKKYGYIFEMDADFSHNPDDLTRLYHACANQGADVAVGSRYVSGGKVKNWPLGRILMSYFASVYVRIVLWINIRDTTAGFKCYKREVLESIDLDLIKFMGYAFQIEMKYTAIKLGFKVVEVPITFIDRKEGTSKMSSSIFKEAFIGVLQMKFSNIKARRLKPSSETTADTLKSK